MEADCDSFPAMSSLKVPQELLNPHAGGAGRRSPDFIVDIIALTCGPFTFLCYFILLVASSQFPPVSPSLSAEATVAHYREHEVGMKAGISIMLLSAVTWPIYVAVLTSRVARIPQVSPTIVLTVIGGGLTEACLFFLVPVLFSTLIYRLDRDPAITQLVSDLALFCTFLPFGGYLAFLSAISIAVLMDNRESSLIPRWIAWVLLITNLIYLPLLGTHWVYEGPLAWNGAVNFWLGVIAFGVQTSIIEFYVYKAIVAKKEV